MSWLRSWLGRTLQRSGWWKRHQRSCPLTNIWGVGTSLPSQRAQHSNGAPRISWVIWRSCQSWLGIQRWNSPRRPWRAVSFFSRILRMLRLHSSVFKKDLTKHANIFFFKLQQIQEVINHLQNGTLAPQLTAQTVCTSVGSAPRFWCLGREKAKVKDGASEEMTKQEPQKHVGRKRTCSLSILVWGSPWAKKANGQPGKLWAACLSSAKSHVNSIEDTWKKCISYKCILSSHVLPSFWVAGVKAAFATRTPSGSEEKIHQYRHSLESGYSLAPRGNDRGIPPFWSNLELRSFTTDDCVTCVSPAALICDVWCW